MSRRAFRPAEGARPAARDNEQRDVFATRADFDGADTDAMVSTVGLLLGACHTEDQLAVLASQLADNVDRRDAQVVLDQLDWRLRVVRERHGRRRAAARHGPSAGTS